VGSLDGHLLVFELDPLTGDILLQGAPNRAAAYEAQVEGAIGCYNGIVIADLVGPDGQNELYVAGSLGLRRWIP
jgi:hypothetical protein